MEMFADIDPLTGVAIAVTAALALLSLGHVARIVYLMLETRKTLRDRAAAQALKEQEEANAKQCVIWVEGHTAYGMLAQDFWYHADSKEFHLTRLIAPHKLWRLFSSLSDAVANHNSTARVFIERPATGETVLLVGPLITVIGTSVAADDMIVVENLGGLFKECTENPRGGREAWDAEQLQNRLRAASDGAASRSGGSPVIRPATA